MARDLTIIHTADLHLGWRPPDRRETLGGRTGRHHQLLFDAFERVLAAVEAEAADLLLICGDTLDGQPVRADIAGALIERAAGLLLAALDHSPRLRLILIAGNHDRPPVYDRPGWRALAGHERARIVVEPTVVELDEPGLSVVALPWGEPGPVTWSRWPTGGPVIAAAHACYPTPLMGPDSDFTLTAEEAATWPVAYIALGHYHQGPTYRVGDTPVVYAGSPEVVALSHPWRGRAVRVTVPPEGPAAWQPLATGALNCLGSLTWDWGSLPAPREDGLRGRLRELASETAMLRVTLTGPRDGPAPLDLDALLADLAPSFFYLDLQDRTSEPVTVEALAAGEAEPVLARFLGIGRRELAEAEAAAEAARAAGDADGTRQADEQAAILRDALLTGFAALAGGGARS
jgi:predicted phosphodiesterase